MKEYAIQYYELGLNPTCISYLKTKYNSQENNPEKSPSHPWKRWQVRRPLLEEVLQLNWEVSNGIGAVLGVTSRCIDIDDCNDYEFIQEFLKYLRLPVDYEWVVKSPNGFHIHIHSGPIYFASDKELINGVLPVFPNDKYSSSFSKIELRWANHIVMPPSKINGKKYYFIKESIPTKGPSLVSMFVVFRTLSEFCGNSFSSHGNFEAQKMVFQIASSSNDYPSAEAFYGTSKEGEIKEAINEAGFIDYKKLPKKARAGKLELYSVSNWDNIRNRINPKCFIDIETTGLIENEFDYENYPRIIQIAIFNSDEKEIKSFYVKPDGFKVPKEIEELTGISNDFLSKNGKSIEEAFRLISKPVDYTIVGHNIDFDLSVIDSEYMRLIRNSNYFVKNQFRDGSQTFCIMKKFTSVFGGKYPKLSEMFRCFFDEEPSDRIHNAVNDLKIIIDCYNVMCLYGYIKDDYENQLIS